MPSLRVLILAGLFYPILFVLNGELLAPLYVAGARFLMPVSSAIGSLSAGALALYLLGTAHWHAPIAVGLIAYCVGAVISIGLLLLFNFPSRASP